MAQGPFGFEQIALAQFVDQSGRGSGCAARVAESLTGEVSCGVADVGLVAGVEAAHRGAGSVPALAEGLHALECSGEGAPIGRCRGTSRP